jgi:hypothetical protein
MVRRLGILIGVLAIAILLWASDRGPDLGSNHPSNSEASERQLEFAPAVESAAKRRTAPEPEPEPIPNPDPSAEQTEPEVEIILEEDLVDIDSLPDPPEAGECDLTIDFVDSITGEAVAGEVKLYRIDAPGNELWTRGDQLQRRGYAKGGQFDATQIPVGTYRAYPLFARLHAPTPMPFDVTGPSTRIEQAVEMPHIEQIQLQLFRSDGVLFNGHPKSFEFRKLGPLPEGSAKTEPNWLKYRNPRDDNVAYFSESGLVTFGIESPWKNYPFDANGFSLWSIRGDNREQPWLHRIEARRNHRLTNIIRLKPTGNNFYAAVFLDPEDLQQALVFPPNQDEIDLRSKFKIQVDAIPLDLEAGRSLDHAWKQCSIEIKLKHADFLSVNLTWQPSQGPLPQIFLSPVKSAN